MAEQQTFWEWLQEGNRLEMFSAIVGCDRPVRVASGDVEDCYLTADIAAVVVEALAHYGAEQAATRMSESAYVDGYFRAIDDFVAARRVGEEEAVVISMRGLDAITAHSGRCVTG